MSINAYREQTFMDNSNYSQMHMSEPEGLHLLFECESKGVSPYTGVVQGLQSYAKHLASGLG